MNEYFTKDAFVSDFTDKSNELVFMNIKKHVTITMLRKNRQCKQHARFCQSKYFVFCERVDETEALNAHAQKSTNENLGTESCR